MKAHYYIHFNIIIIIPVRRRLFDHFLPQWFQIQNKMEGKKKLVRVLQFLKEDDEKYSFFGADKK